MAGDIYTGFTIDVANFHKFNLSIISFSVENIYFQKFKFKRTEFEVKFKFIKINNITSAYIESYSYLQPLSLSLFLSKKNYCKNHMTGTLT